MLPVYILLWFFSSSRRWWRDIINLESDKFAPKSMGSHTFVIEIDRQDSKEQERFRWRWPQRDMDNNSSTASGKRGTVVEELMLFLDEKVGVPTTAMGDDDDERAGHYTVEMHDHERGAWIPLVSSAFPVGNIPKNCRLRVSVPASTPNASTGKKSDSDKHRLGAIETRLALPWKRFDRDLGSGGLEVCGRKVLVQDVPNSDEGTGLFTWDGSVLLAKYVEHRASEIVDREEDHHQPNEKREQARSRVPWEEKETSPVRLAGFSCNAGSPRRVFRVLELGCGTGLSGLASAVALGQHLLEDTMASSLRNERGDRMADTARGMLEVVLTDLPYALENARANIARNTESLAAEGVDAVVFARELDWLRPVPPELMSEDFDLIIAADVVWLDELVEPLVRTFERLTANWASDGLDTSLECRSSISRDVSVGAESAIDPFAREGIRRPGGSCPVVPEFTGVICQRESGGGGILEGVTHRLEEGWENGDVRSNWGFHVADGVSERGQVRQFKQRRRILLAYQWRSERTGRALLRELARAFHVRKIPPEDCHPDYKPDTRLCLFEAIRR